MFENLRRQQIDTFLKLAEVETLVAGSFERLAIIGDPQHRERGSEEAAKARAQAVRARCLASKYAAAMDGGLPGED
jgi:hypothetical protein